MARIGQGPVGGDLPGGVGATDRSGRHGTSVAAALPRAWMVDKVLAAVLARDARHRRRKVTYFRSPEHQETDSASSRNMLNLLVGPIPSQELQQERRTERFAGAMPSYKARVRKCGCGGPCSFSVGC